ncbi:MAG: histidyl-tRNA synthetase [Blastocatellia bacterium]|nr:histidyl-tRNA synthetase [Blastocatellia bacterium]
MPSSRTQPARGMRDFLPADVRKREYVIGVIKEVYERYGFEPLETPAVENIETLLGKYGEEGNQLIFKILKRGEHEKSGEADLALRYDLTVPLARVVAQYQNELPKFFKRYQIQPVWRADRPARGRFREFYQCDVDVLGSRSMVVEAEILAAASDVLTKLRFDGFTIRLNHRQVLAAALAETTQDKHEGALVALDKLDRIGKEGVYEEFNARGIDSAAPRKLLELLWQTSEKYAFGNEQDQSTDLESYNADILSGLQDSIGDHEQAKHGIVELKKILEYSKATAADGHIKIDPSLARGLSYYTGAIMEIRVRDLAGSLGGGGRYDNLVGMFLGKDVPACGFSLGLERIIVVMTERGMFPSELVSSPADVMVTIWNEDSVAESLALATELRKQGLRVDLYPEADKMGKQFKYASSRGISFVAIVGDDERVRGEVAIKDLRSGEQRSVKRNEVAAAIRDKES